VPVVVVVAALVAVPVRLLCVVPAVPAVPVVVWLDVDVVVPELSELSLSMMTELPYALSTMVSLEAIEESGLSSDVEWPSECSPPFELPSGLSSALSSELELSSVVSSQPDVAAAADASATAPAPKTASAARLMRAAGGLGAGLAWTLASTVAPQNGHTGSWTRR
jgi:hypothetical protein